MKNVVVAPSILGVDVSKAASLCDELIEKGADIIHFDVMDGKFVPNTSFTFDDFKLIKDNAKENTIFDVHLMVEDVYAYVEKYVQMGADIITFHYEAVKESEILHLASLMHAYNIRVGISVKPNTDVSVLAPFLSEMDLVLVMSVEPGAGGQKFNENMLSKVEYLNNFRKLNECHYVIEIDGGINDVTGKMSVDKGVDYLVAGSYIVKSDDRRKAIASLK